MVQHHRCEKDWETSPKADAIKKVVAAYHTDEVKKLSKKHQTVWINQFGNKKQGGGRENSTLLLLYRAWIVRKSSS